MNDSMWGPATMAGDPTNPANYGIPSGAWPPGAGQISKDASAAPKVAASVGFGGSGLSLTSPDSPMFWVAAVLAVVFGAVGFNAHARVGPVRTGVDVGSA